MTATGPVTVAGETTMHDRSPHAEARAPADVRRSLSDWGDGLCCAALAAVALGAATAVACWLWQIPPLR